MVTTSMNRPSTAPHSEPRRAGSASLRQVSHHWQSSSQSSLSSRHLLHSSGEIFRAPFQQMPVESGLESVPCSIVGAAENEGIEGMDCWTYSESFWTQRLSPLCSAQGSHFAITPSHSARLARNGPQEQCAGTGGYGFLRLSPCEAQGWDHFLELLSSLALRTFVVLPICGLASLLSCMS